MPNAHDFHQMPDTEAMIHRSRKNLALKQIMSKKPKPYRGLIGFMIFVLFIQPFYGSQIACFLGVSQFAMTIMASVLISLLDIGLMLFVQHKQIEALHAFIEEEWFLGE